MDVCKIVGQKLISLLHKSASSLDLVQLSSEVYC